MLIKFIADRLQCQIDTWLFPHEWENTYITWISGQIKRLFNPIEIERTDWEQRKEKIELKRFWWKYLNIRYSSGEDVVWNIIDLPRWKIFILPIKVAEDEWSILDNREVIDWEDWTILYKIDPQSNIFSDYFVWIYLTNEVDTDDKWRTNLNWYVFYTQKGKNSIKALVKSLIMELIPWSTILMEASVTKKKIESFEWAVKSIVFKKDVIPTEIAPDIDDSVKQSVSISIKTEIKIKSSSKLENIKAMFPWASKKAFKKIAEKEYLWVKLENMETEIWNTKFWNLWMDENEEIVWIMQDYKEISSREYGLTKFTELCKEFFN